MEVEPINNSNWTLEVFCVDTSRSMRWFNRTTAARLIIAQPPQDQNGQQLTNNHSHYTALVLFCSAPELAVPFALNDEKQMKEISEKISNAKGKGSAIYTAIEFCESVIFNFTKQFPQSWNVLLHLFTDGSDNASDSYRKQTFGGLENSIKGNTVGHHRLLYSFGSKFEEVSSLGEQLSATVIIVDTSAPKQSLEERDKIIFHYLQPVQTRKHTVSKGFNITKGDNPDLLALYHLLIKIDKVYTEKFTSTEGIFRQNGIITDVKLTARRLTIGIDTLNDYKDPILLSHALKTVLKTSNIIPKYHQTQIQTTIISPTIPLPQKISQVSAILSDIPETNFKCLKIVLDLLGRVVKGQKKSTHIKGSNCTESFYYFCMCPTRAG